MSVPSAASANCYQVYALEYAYLSKSVNRAERESANCMLYLPSQTYSESYIHCDGTQLRLTDSTLGSEQYTNTDYYVWTAGSSNSQLLFIFPTRVHFTTITVHYYSDSSRGLPRLRFYAVPDDFDIWDAVISGYKYIEFAAVQPMEVPEGSTNISVHSNFSSKNVILNKIQSSYTFALSEVEFFTCNSKDLNLISKKLSTF